MNTSAKHIIAADIGNSRMKFGRFVLPCDGPKSEALPEPTGVVSLAPDSLRELSGWLNEDQWQDAEFAIGSVQRARTADLIDWLRKHSFAGDIQLLTSDDLPLEIDVPQPQRVGMDRLLAAVAANAIRTDDSMAAIVDLGTAITVDVVSSEGAYQGGAIAPGLAISARALHDATDALPAFDVASLDDAIAPIGRDTVAAMKSGLFLGAVGAIRELIVRQVGELSSDTNARYEVYVCGGFAKQVAHLLSANAIHLPHLILQGIAITVQNAKS